MKRLIFSALVLSAVTANAQVKDGMVGINTDEPRATMHIEPGVSESKGLIIPRITAAQMKTMTNLAHFGADHHAIITYLKETLPAADRTGKLAEVSEAGYYFYNHTAAKWQKFGGGAEQDLRAVGNNDHITKDAGIGENGTSAGTGYRNIGIGQKALLNGTSGSDNIAIGSHSLKNLTTGHRNVAIGSNTLENNTTGANNVGIGSAFYFPNGGTISSNTNVGIGTTVYSLGNGGSMTGGTNIGMGSGVFSLQKTNAQFSGYSNTGIGESIFNLTNGDLTGNTNIGMGNSLYYMRSGDMASSGNIAIGGRIYELNKTAGAVFTGYGNTSIGQNLFHLQNGNLTGSSNIGLGISIYDLNSGNMTGLSNIGIGSTLYSLNSGNMEGQGNIGIGQYSYYVVKGNITNMATHNIALGRGIYLLNDGNTTRTFSGAENIGIGNRVYQLSAGNISGNRNIGMGSDAFSVYSMGDISGEDNIGIGTQAMYSIGITGNYNIALGYRAMSTSGRIAGTDNIAIGNEVLNTNTNIGSYNIGIGNKALVGDMGRGNANIQLGNNTVGTPLAGQLNNVVAIGNEMNGLTYSNTDSNTILLGVRSSSPNSPKVGVGTYNPQAKLHVKGELMVETEYGNCTSSNAGAIRFQSGHFYGCNGSTWKQLDN